MKELFLYLCGFSVVTSLAVIVAVILRPVLKKGPSYIRCILWALVFLRLLIPVGFVGIPFSVPAPFATAPETVSTPQDGGKPAENLVTDNSTAQNPAPDHVQTPAQSPAQSPAQTPANDEIPAHSDIAAAPVTEQIEPQGENGVDVLSVVSVVWVCGVIVLLCYMVASSLLLRYRVRNAIVYDSRIRIIDKDCSPFVSGLFRPMIYIPASVDKKDWPYIIAHETSHIKRLDHVLKPLAFLVLCFYWFNPLIWVAYLLLNKDIEYACDERTVKHMENQDRKAYSLALLSVSRGANIVPAMPLSFGKVSVKERIKRVMNRKIPVWAICLTVIVCASLSVVIACTPDAKKSADTDSIDSSSVDAEVSENNSGSESNSESESADAIALEISLDYIDPLELDPNDLFFVEQFDTFEMVKIQANKEVKNFKFIEVVYDAETTDPYAGNILFEVASLTPGKPFYARTHIYEGLSNRGISFVDDNGETVCYRISYDSYDNASTSLLLDAISGEPVKPNEESETSTANESNTDIENSTGNESNNEPPKELPEVSGIFADYADDSELDDDSLLFDEGGYTLVKIRVTKEVKNFKFITVIDDGPHAGETLFEVASLTPDRPFYARTIIGEGFSERGISYVNEDGETVYCRINYDGRGGSGFGLQSIPGNPDNQGEEPIPDFTSMSLRDFFSSKYFHIQSDAYDIIDHYIRGEIDDMRPHMLDETVVLPDHAPQNTIADYRDYCITSFYNEPYSYNGEQTEKVTVSISLRCAKEGQEGYQNFYMEFVQIPHADDSLEWKVIRFDVKDGYKPDGEDAIALNEFTTVDVFFQSTHCQELQCAAFNFINALYTPNFEELRQLVVDPSWVPEDPNAWENRSRDDYAGYGITWVGFAPYTLDGKEVLSAYFHLSMFYAVPGEEGICDPLLRFAYVDNKWKVLNFDFGA